MIYSGLIPKYWSVHCMVRDAYCLCGGQGAGGRNTDPMVCVKPAVPSGGGGGGGGGGARTPLQEICMVL